jgi:glycosyltransferase involved in cell wall biosynthesis
MQVYRFPQAEEEARYGALYRKCRDTEGVEYVGSLPQPELANHLRSSALLAYPNTFAETSCIAILEAMASGCLMVTSDLGALAETTAGFARLIPRMEDRESYSNDFVEEVVQVLHELAGPDTSEAEDRLRRQVDHINQTATWPVRAEEWRQWLQDSHSTTALTHV